MTPKQLLSFRSTLESLLDAATRETFERRQSLEAEPSADAFDRVGLDIDRDLAVADLSRNSQLIRQVRAALARMEEGVFGTCQACGETIPIKRLKAVPCTPFCIRCQEAADRGMANAA